MTATTTSNHDRLQRAAHEHLLLHFARNGAFGPGGGDLPVLERGEGPYVFDTEGRRFIDALSCLFCSQIGYSHGEEMAAASSAQLSTLAFNTNWGTATPAAIELAQRLSELTPPGISKAFFTNGGSESVEAAWKIARQYHVARSEPQRRVVIARHNAYHGVTTGALSFTGVEPMKEPFGPPAIPVRRISNTNPYRSLDGLAGEALTARLLEEAEQAIADEGPERIAAIIAEPVQNAGGCLVPPPGYWPGLRAIADRCGAVLIADEVITGFGRIGHWFASERYDARPHIITVAKGITSAYAPMGAALVDDQIAAPLYEDGRTLLHGITFGGHPVSAAIALANLEIFEREGVLENVRALEGRLRDRMRELLALPIVGDVRGDGFFWAAEMVGEGGRRLDQAERDLIVRKVMPAKLHEVGLIARADDRGDAVVQIAPPLIADADLLDEIVKRLGDALEQAGEALAA